jgi:hypothetical protein
MGILDALRDPEFRRDVGYNANQLAQSMSNTVAGSITEPVNALAWLLRKSGLPIPQNPIGGSDWAAQQGLTREVPEGLPKAAGETLGLITPMAGTQQGAAAVARGIKQMGENAAAPAMLNKQAGMLFVAPNPVDKAKLLEVQEEMKKLGAPKLRAYFDGEKYIGIEGSHRAAAAKNLGLIPEIQEVNLKQWAMPHDFTDIKEKASVARLLDYLDYGTHRGARYYDFD